MLGYVILVFKKVSFSNETNNVHLISNVLVIYLIILTMVGVRNPKSIYYHNLNIYTYVYIMTIVINIPFNKSYDITQCNIIINYYQML